MGVLVGREHEHSTLGHSDRVHIHVRPLVSFGVASPRPATTAGTGLRVPARRTRGLGRGRVGEAKEGCCACCVEHQHAPKKADGPPDVDMVGREAKGLHGEGGGGGGGEKI